MLPACFRGTQTFVGQSFLEMLTGNATEFRTGTAAGHATTVHLLSGTQELWTYGLSFQVGPVATAPLPTLSV
jgi:hypothetical protein